MPSLGVSWSILEQCATVTARDIMDYDTFMACLRLCRHLLFRSNIYICIYISYIYISYIYKLKIVIPFFLSIHLKIQIFAVHHSAFKVAEQGCLTQLCTGGFHKLLRCKSKGKSNNSETAAVLVRSAFKVSLTLQFKGLHSLC